MTTNGYPTIDVDPFGLAYETPEAKESFLTIHLILDQIQARALKLIDSYIRNSVPLQGLTQPTYLCTELSGMDRGMHTSIISLLRSDLKCWLLANS
jgi:hypothetical protein